MRAMTWDDFAGGEGRAYTISLGERAIELVLEKAYEVPSAGREGGSFRLEFRGPPAPVLEQAIYPLRQGEDGFEIFIVPVGLEPKGALYEAIFY